MTRFSEAGVDVGLGFNSTTSARLRPALILGTSWGNSRLSAGLTGVKSNYYYHSSYNLAFYKTWKSGDLFFADVESGLGVGGLYSLRSFQDEGSSTATNKSDFVLGPAFEMQWLFSNLTFLSIEVIWGLRDFSSHLALNAQDVVTFSLGVRSW